MSIKNWRNLHRSMSYANVNILATGQGDLEIGLDKVLLTTCDKNIYIYKHEKNLLVTVA